MGKGRQNPHVRCHCHMTQPEANTAAGTDPPQNLNLRFTLLFTRKKHSENHRELIEVVGHIVLPTGWTRVLLALVDCGSADNKLEIGTKI